MTSHILKMNTHYKTQRLIADTGKFVTGTLLTILKEHEHKTSFPNEYRYHTINPCPKLYYPVYNTHVPLEDWYRVQERIYYDLNSTMSNLVKNVQCSPKSDNYACVIIELDLTKLQDVSFETERV
jgi:hypothetical protein